ncbi:hypothetical protein SESBI_25461 [Sesbania bispinosa]|nr:hypothetical protein SESBI_25461 [Sesbania bispinosa]
MKGAMKIDSNPFSTNVNYVEPFEVNMVGTQPIEDRATYMAIKLKKERNKTL